ncbi:YkgJ family cysteine cluster protein [Desulfobacterales bacterium HSG16]|nr:YkgJ family cysteine cluster protein [Desulfobacterales bacterium HSG16]
MSSSEGLSDKINDSSSDRTKAKPSDIFECTLCGECCKGYGGTYVTPADIEAIAAYINEDPKLFIDRCCQLSGNRYVLAQNENGVCMFWDSLCTIHPVKPRMCRAWPFINSVLIDTDNWHMMAGSCPGMRTDVPNHLIAECVREVIKSTGNNMYNKPR